MENEEILFVNRIANPHSKTELDIISNTTRGFLISRVQPNPSDYFEQGKGVIKKH
jgi:hypothetical protein